MTANTDEIRCDTCFFWKRTGLHLGECRRFPPTVIAAVGFTGLASPHGRRVSAFPDASLDWGCGEHKPKEGAA